MPPVKANQRRSLERPRNEPLTESSPTASAAQHILTDDSQCRACEDIYSPRVSADLADPGDPTGTLERRTDTIITSGQPTEGSKRHANKHPDSPIESHASTVLDDELSNTLSEQDPTTSDGPTSDTQSIIRYIGHVADESTLEYSLRGMDGVAELETASLPTPTSPCPAYEKQTHIPIELHDSEQSKKSFVKVAKQYINAYWWLSVVGCLAWMATIDLLHCLAVLEGPVGRSWYSPTRAITSAPGSQGDDSHVPRLQRRRPPMAWELVLWSLLVGGRTGGGLLAPLFSKRLGYRNSFIASAAMVLLVVPLLLASVFATSASGLARFVLLATGECLLAVPFGLISVLIIPYVSDVAPLKRRGTMLCILSSVFTISMVCMTFSSAALRRAPIQQSRFVYILMFVLALICTAGTWYIPESPRYVLRRQELMDDDSTIQPAFPALKHSEEANEAAVTALRLLDEREAALFGSGFLACFRKTNRRRTFALVSVYYTAMMLGLSLYGLVVATTDGGAFVATGTKVQVTAVVLCCAGGSIISLFLSRYLGRRTMWIAGLWLFLLIAVTIVGLANPFVTTTRLRNLYVQTAVRHGHISRLVTAFFYLALVVFAAVLPALSCALSAEIPSGHLMVETIAISASLSTVLVILSVTSSWLIGSVGSRGLAGMPAILLRGIVDVPVWMAVGWVIVCLCGLATGRGRPETKDKSPEEVNRAYEVLCLVKQRRNEEEALGPWSGE
ncbi:major facilitator superfamily domain-containing protein [Emericellopsis atlantica]|uniref:Major facilitator superfamily domain-containing protein n=1 Tax=Emericellopsis atlantica TaxID=2614577 RepID=A0A9P7ZKQ4_9HYPO|nr:major facilitator superfamily domain-containing protein [Emericellopsis atlantica]KAG9253913.1 major facilitator superfamily domain-containing protein [Emericellopsis atlantica]